MAKITVTALNATIYTPSNGHGVKPGGAVDLHETHASDFHDAGLVLHPNRTASVTVSGKPGPSAGGGGGLAGDGGGMAGLASEAPKPKR